MWVKKNGGSTRSNLLLVPPLAEGMAAAIFVERDEEDAVEFGLETRRNNNKGSPPAGDSVLGSYGENFVSKMDVLLGLGDVCPVFEDGLLSAHWFEEWGDLIGAVFREKVRGGLRVAAFPGAAVGIQPIVESLQGYWHGRAIGMAGQRVHQEGRKFPCAIGRPNALK